MKFRIFRKEERLQVVFLAALIGLASLEARSQEVPSPTRWAFDVGYGRRLWESQNISADQREYQDRAKNGLVLGADVSVFPWRYAGLGLVYNQFANSIADSDIEFGDGSRGRSSDTYRIRYAGPALYLRRDFGAFNAILQAGAGCIYYKNDHEASDFPGVLQGFAPGFHAALSADYRVLSRLAFGVTARLLHGTLDEVDYNGIRLPIDDISLTRFDVAAGLRFYP